MILLPLHFFQVIFFPTALIFPSPLHNLIFFPKRLNKLPPRGGGRNFIHPWPIDLDLYCPLPAVYAFWHSTKSKGWFRNERPKLVNYCAFWFYLKIFEVYNFIFSRRVPSFEFDVTSSVLTRILYRTLVRKQYYWSFGFCK